MIKRFLSLLALAFLVSVWLLSARADAQNSASGATAITDVPEAAARLLELVNGERTGSGLPDLSLRDDVSAIAWDFSRQMATRDEIWHNQDYFSAESRERLQAAALGENVAFNSSVDDAHARLMASSGHRANILNASFTVVGIGVVRDGRGTLFITQDFLAPRPPRQAAASAPPQGPASPSLATTPAAPTAPVPPSPPALSAAVGRQAPVSDRRPSEVEPAPPAAAALIRSHGGEASAASWVRPWAVSAVGLPAAAGACILRRPRRTAHRLRPPELCILGTG